MDSDNVLASRTRSEYHLKLPCPALAIDTERSIRFVAPQEVDAEELALVLLEAYRGTTDDEGEDMDDARAAIRHFLGRAVRGPSVVARDGARAVAFSFVVRVNGLHYIDPVAVAPERKRAGLGRSVVSEAIRRLPVGASAVGAVITDGNEPSERLFRGLGFQRVGAWGPQAEEK